MVIEGSTVDDGVGIAVLVVHTLWVFQDEGLHHSERWGMKYMYIRCVSHIYKHTLYTYRVFGIQCHRFHGR